MRDAKKQIIAARKHGRAYLMDAMRATGLSVSRCGPSNAALLRFAHERPDVLPEAYRSQLLECSKKQLLIGLGLILLGEDRIDGRRKVHKKKQSPPKPAKGFYASWEWKKLRFETLKRYGAKCMLCGSTERIVVDHIKPRTKFPHLELDPENLQVLCNDCNMGKSNDDYTDFRDATG